MLKPLGDHIIVKTLTVEETTKGGIVLPDTAKEKPQQAEVIAVGPGKLTESGKRIEMELKKGDRVVFSKYGGTEISVDGEDYLILSERDVLAVIE